MHQCPDEVSAAILRCSARVDERGGPLIGRKPESEQLAGWLDRRPRLGPSEDAEWISPLFVVSGSSGIGKTSLVAHETQSWRERTGDHVWWLRAPWGLLADNERDLFHATRHAAGFCCGHEPHRGLQTISPPQVREQIKVLSVVRSGTLVLDGVSRASDVEHFRTLGFRRVVVTTTSEDLVDHLVPESRLRLRGLTVDDARTLLLARLRVSPELRNQSVEMRTIVAESMGNPQRLLTLLQEGRRERDARLERLIVMLAVTPNVPFDVVTVALLCDCSVDEANASLARLVEYGCLQQALPSGQFMLHDVVRQLELQRLQDESAEWSRALEELIAGLRRLLGASRALGSDSTDLRWGQTRDLFYGLNIEETFRELASDRRPEVAQLFLSAYQRALQDSADRVNTEQLLSAAERYAAGDQLTLATCQLERGRLSAHGCDWKRACELFDASAQGAFDAGASLLRLEALICSAQGCLAAGELDQARARYERGVNVREDAEAATNVEMEVLAQLSDQLSLLGLKLDYDSGRALASHEFSALLSRVEALLTSSRQNPALRWDAELLLIDLLLTRRELGDLERALMVCEAALTREHEGAQGEAEAVLAKYKLLRGVVKLHQRALAGAFDDIREAERRASELNETELLIDAQLYLIEVLIERRQFDHARHAAAALVARLEASPPGAPWEASAYLMAARAARACGDLHPALESIRLAERALDGVGTRRDRDEILLEKARVRASMGERPAAKKLAESVRREARDVRDEHTQVAALIELLRMRDGLPADELTELSDELRGLLTKIESPLGEWELRRLDPSVHLHDARLILGKPLDQGLREAMLAGEEAISREVLLDDMGSDQLTDDALERDALLSVYLCVQSQRRVPWILFAGRWGGGTYRVYDCARTKPFPGDLGAGEWGDAREFIVALITMLQRLHWLGYSHGELVPRNVRIDQDKKPVVIGFSASKSEALVRAATERAGLGLSVGDEDARALARMIHHWLMGVLEDPVSRRAFVFAVPAETRAQLKRIGEEGGTLAELLALFISAAPSDMIPWVGRDDVIEQVLRARQERRLVRITGQAGSGRGPFMRALEARLTRLIGIRVLRVEPPREGQTTPLDNVWPSLESEELRALPAGKDKTQWDAFVEKVTQRILGGATRLERDDERLSLVVLVPQDDGLARLDTATVGFVAALERRAAKATNRVSVVRCGSPGEKLPKFQTIELHDLSESELERLFTPDSQAPRLVQLAARALYARTAGHPRSTLHELRRWVSMGWATYNGAMSWRVGPLALAALDADPVLAPDEELPPDRLSSELSKGAQEVLALLRLAGPGYPIDRLYHATAQLNGAEVLFLTEHALERHRLVRTNHERSSFMSVVPFTIAEWTREDVNRRLVKLAEALDAGRFHERRFWLFYQACDEAALNEAVAWASSLRRRSQPERVSMYIRIALMLLDRSSGRAEGGLCSPSKADTYRLRLMEEWVLAAIDALSAAELAHAISELARAGSGHSGLLELRRFAVAYRTARFERPTAHDSAAAFGELDSLLHTITHPDLSRLIRLARLTRPGLSPAQEAQQRAEMYSWADQLPSPEARRRCIVKLENRAGHYLHFGGHPWEALWRYERHPPDPEDKIGRVEWLISLTRAKLELFDRLDEARAHIAEVGELLQKSPSLARTLELDWVNLILAYRAEAALPADEALGRWESLELRYSELLLHERLHFYWLQYAAVLYRCSAAHDRESREWHGLRERARVLAARLVPKAKRTCLSMVELMAKALQLACSTQLDKAGMDEQGVRGFLKQTASLPNLIAAVEIFGLFGRGLQESAPHLRESLIKNGEVSLTPFEPLLRRQYTVGARSLRRVALSINESLGAWEPLRDFDLIAPVLHEPLAARLERFFTDAFTPLEILKLTDEQIAPSTLALEPVYTVSSHRSLMERAVQELSRAKVIPQTLERLKALRPARNNEIEFMQSLLPTTPTRRG